MKLIHSTKFASAAIAVAAMTTLVSCGDDKDNDIEIPMVVSKDFQGDFQLARLEKGKTEPTAAGCLPGSENTGMKISLAVKNVTAETNVVEYVNDAKCEGKNTLAIKKIHTLQRMTSKDGVQTFKSEVKAYGVEVKGKETVAMLNEREACGHKDWQEKIYTQLDAHLKDCTEGNTERTQIPSRKEIEESKYIELLFKKQGKSLAIETRDNRKKDSKFGDTEYYVKK